ncbi:type 11 methyltransferase [Mycolicibacterium aurum]|uniref:Type 11 methyltransferase n=1 Tax=Mycolicibacterium aurum TaxID=1791 RepID=A0A3S4SK86_MYCAU|nr:class I SAM-dependent methyltransferase [Mycolicibacterium aurum]VEG55007.1 type 11 methyltransferase [Mycolicibacterium aurum]
MTHDSAAWDERYSQEEQLFSGRPNGALVAEVAEMAPGRALDVGCGEGGDTAWLVKQGWRVTALDVSRVALDRAMRRAGDATTNVEWVHAGLVDAALAQGAFDLVSAQYPALLRTPTNDAERTLIGAVAPGGTLLVVHHADIDVEAAKAHGFDPADYVMPTDVAALLDDGWEIEVDERRVRDVPAGGGSGHTHDVVLRARRSASKHEARCSPSPTA